MGGELIVPGTQRQRVRVFEMDSVGLTEIIERALGVAEKVLAVQPDALSTEEGRTALAHEIVSQFNRSIDEQERRIQVPTIQPPRDIRLA